MLVCALVAHDANRLHCCQEYCSCLPSLIIERNLDLAVLHLGRNACSKNPTSLFAGELHLVVAQTFHEYIVCILQDAYSLRSNVAKYAHSQAWTWERMTRNEMLRHSHRASYAAHLVLEQPFQRFAELQMHFLWQSAHVVVALDNLSCNVETLDAVRIDSALCEPFCPNLLLGLGIEHFHEVPADDLALLLRIGDSGEVGKEFLRCVHTDNVKSETLVVLHHIMVLVLAQHTVIHEDTRKVIADCLVEQYGSNA